MKYFEFHKILIKNKQRNEGIYIQLATFKTFFRNSKSSKTIECLSKLSTQCVIPNETKTDFPSCNNEVLCIQGEEFREYFMNHFGIQGFNVLVRIYLNLPKHIKSDFQMSDKKCRD